jgi:NAD(P)-dependent dehydrogenase (short-subunit alcohol dehydrogenase family)
MLRPMPIPENPRAVVTGASSGLGRAFCLTLSRRGARILAADIDAAGLAETRSLCGGNLETTRCDVSRIDDVEALAAEAERRLGGVDLVINNAGVAAGGPVGEVPIDDWRWCLGVTLWGVIHGCHVFVPRLRKQGSGHIINVASAAGLVAPPQMAPYSVAKYGAVAISECLQQELAGSGVGVTVLCPTFFKTNIHASARGTDGRMRGFIEKLMARAKLDANDVANAALDGAARGQLYVLPMTDGLVMWRIKRLMPERYAKLIPKVLKMLERRM